MEALPRDHELMWLARIMLVVFSLLALWSVVHMIRTLRRPVDATSEKLKAFEKIKSVGSRFCFGGIAMSIFAIVTKQYYLIGAGALLFMMGLPVVVGYLRVKSALRDTTHPRAN
jgi:hypothetical protein